MLLSSASQPASKALTAATAQTASLALVKGREPSKGVASKWDELRTYPNSLSPFLFSLIFSPRDSPKSVACNIILVFKNERKVMNMKVRYRTSGK